MATRDQFTPSRPRPQQDRPAYGDRPAFSGPPSGGRPAFSPRPPFAGGPARPGGTEATAPPVAASRLRLREGDREVEINGTPAFIRQTLDDLPSLFAKLTGTPVPTPAAISIAAQPRPAAAEPTEVSAPVRAERTSASASARRGASASNGTASHTDAATTYDPDSLEHDVFAVLRRSKRALKVAEIRAQLSGDVTGQQVRRILERADRVVANNEKPTGYRLR